MVADELVIRIRAVFEGNETLNKAKASISSLEKEINKTSVAFDRHNKGIMRGFRDILQPISLLRSTVLRLSFIWGSSFGIILKAVSDVSKEIKNLDTLAIKLGVSSSDLSRKIYGFNIVTAQAVIGTGQLLAISENLHKSWIKLGVKASEIWGETTIGNRAKGIELRLSEEILRPRRKERPFAPVFLTPEEETQIKARSRQEAIRQLNEEYKARLRISKEGQQLELELSDAIKKLTLSTTEYKDNQLKQQVELFRRYGMGERAISEFITTYHQRTDEDRQKTHKKMIAERLRAEGSVIAAMKIENEIALSDFRWVWGEDGTMIKEFLRGQEALLRQQELTMLGLKNINQIISDGTRNIVSGMKSTWASFFNDVFVGELKKGSDYFRIFGQAILNTWANMLAEMVTGWIATMGSLGGGGGKKKFGLGNILSIASSVIGFGNLFSGGSTIVGGVGGVNTGMQMTPMGLAPTWSPFRAHSGGFIKTLANMPRFQEGGEVPILAQSGEFIVNRNATRNNLALLERINRGESTSSSVILNVSAPVIIQAIDTQTGAEFVMQNRRAIADAIGSQLIRNAQIRELIAQTRK